MHLIELDQLCLKSGFSLPKLLKMDPSIDNVIASKRLSELRKYRKQLAKLLKIPVVEQKSPEWYKMREDIVTASDFAQALGKGKFGTVKQFFQKKCEKSKDDGAASKTNPFFKWGNMFEPVALDIYSIMRGVKVHSFGLIQHPTQKFFGASPDGINELGQMVELKCPKRRKIAFGDDVVQQYYYQIQGQLDVCGLEECDYFECDFDVCETEEQFIEVSEDYNYRGVIVEVSDNSYLYKMNESTESMLSWSKSFDRPISYVYWMLRGYNIQRVYRDTKFLNENLKLLNDVWNKVIYYRNNKEAYEIEVMNEIKIDTQRYNQSQCQINLSGWSFIDDAE